MENQDFKLSEFEAWCRGEGRSGGVHYNALEAAERFRMFKHNTMKVDRTHDPTKYRISEEIDEN